MLRKKNLLAQTILHTYTVCICAEIAEFIYWDEFDCLSAKYNTVASIVRMCVCILLEI